MLLEKSISPKLNLNSPSTNFSSLIQLDDSFSGTKMIIHKVFIKQNRKYIDDVEQRT